MSGLLCSFDEADGTLPATCASCFAWQAPNVIEASTKFGIGAQIIGRVEAKEGTAEVVVSSEYGTFTY